MKAQVFSRISIPMVLMLLAGNLFAQTDFRTLHPIAAAASNEMVTKKTQAQFYRLFSTAEDVRWFNREKRFFAKFSMDDQDHVALFTKSGALVYHNSYGFEKNLPTSTRQLIKSVYFDYAITRVVKVEEQNRTVWVVNMEDEKSIIIVRVENDEMEEVKNLHKSS
jgi:hypothetical protein